MNNAGKTRYDKKALAFGLLALLAAMGLLTYLNTKITFYSDDYWYATFFQSGPIGFLKEMYRHYMQTNGRLYVHVIIPIVLLFGTKLFLVLSPILLAGLYWFGAKVLDEECKFETLLLQAAFGILFTLACDVMYLRMTILWISAYFNYVFPVLMTAVAVFFQMRRYQGVQGKTEYVFGLIFAVMAGASTEQSAIVTLVIVWGFAAMSWLFGGVKFKIVWTYPVFVLLGFLTILLAPGSWARVDRGVEGGILSCLIPSVFAKRYYDAMLFVVKYPSTVVMLAALDILAAALCLLDKRLSKGLLAGVVFAAVQIAAWAFDLPWVGCVCYGVSLLTLAILFLLRREYWLTGLFLLGSLAANMMLIITTLTFERTAMVGLVTLIVVLVSLLFRVVRRVPGWVRILSLVLVAAVCVAAYVPTAVGYTESKKIVDKNMASVEQSKITGEAFFDIDIDHRYRFTMPFEGSYFYENFRKCYGMDPDAKLTFTSSKWDLSRLQLADGTLCEFPILADETGVYIPFTQAVRAAGGELVYSWQDHSQDVTLGDRHYFIEVDGTVWLEDEGGKMARQENTLHTILPFSETYTLVYARADEMADLGLSWTVSGDTYVMEAAK